MPFTMIATFQAKPGEEQRLQDELGAMIEPSLAEPGCLAYRPLVDPNQPGAMVIIEEWTGEDALEEHFATPHFKHVAEALDEILVEPFAATTLTRVDVAEAA
jgi:quinol monooxygenase YgiN